MGNLVQGVPQPETHCDRTVKQLLSLLVVTRHSASNLRNLLSQLASNLKAIVDLELKIPFHEGMKIKLIKQQGLTIKGLNIITQAYVTTDDSCMKYHEMHALHRCTQFLNGNFQKHTEFPPQNRLCFNCLQVGYIVRQ
ncbi:hypothetical protein PR048_008399 [Dryococelus australis]|uniref:Uncharacterized protein n=1 Tax=Dryococelus australis TaxID=614101 RepID=A0ABQ9HX37_9NEOP|nr:hypothetical protein PR048_008399 [Dryococelus australis]